MFLINLPATDTGGVPLVYDDSTGEIKQSPAWIAQYAPGQHDNVYGPGDVFLVPGGGTITYGALLAQQAAVNRAMQAGNNSNPGNGSVIKQGGAAETTINEIVAILKQPIWPQDPHSWPTWTVVLGAGAAYALLGRRRRR